jgi:hypothetical protein
MLAPLVLSADERRRLTAGRRHPGGDPGIPNLDFQDHS